jgi:hypothetical protein
MQSSNAAIHHDMTYQGLDRHSFDAFCVPRWCLKSRGLSSWSSDISMFWIRYILGFQIIFPGMAQELYPPLGF